MTDTFQTELELLAPRLVSIRFHGLFTAEEATHAFNQIEEAVGGEPFFLLEADMSDIERATPEARRITAQRFNALPDRAVAVVGGSFAQRMIAKLVLTATSMLGVGGKTTVSFFDNRDSARAWLNDYAAKHHG